MTRSILSVVAVLSLSAVAIAPSSCSGGGIGDPCIPEDEYDPNFAGFVVEEENIESRSFQCETRICLVNHFQGRVSCPLGQAARQACAGPDDGSCGGDAGCVEAGVLAPSCESNDDCAQFAGCNSAGKFCECTSDDHCPAGLSCDTNARQCKSYVCHTPGNCQSADGENSADQGCCVPGTDTPIGPSVCGQCDSQSPRRAEQAVYCSCRCAAPPGQENDEANENFNFCECPEGFSCEQVRQDVGLGDKQLAGGYCVKNGTATDPQQAPTECGNVEGHWDPVQCRGTQG